MASDKIPKIIQWWVTPKLPKEHIYVPQEKRPKDFYQIIRVYSRKWMAHAVKRRIAKYYLVFLQRFFGLKVIGITGSCGKTTVKEMVAKILSSGGETQASFKNIDPVYNIPTTILKCRPSTEYLVLEMGVEYPGEMDFYLWLAKPVVGVITNIYPTHTQFFKSIRGVAKEKVNLVKYLPKDGFAILNRKNKYTKSFEKKTEAKVIWYGDNSEVKAKNLIINKSLNTKFTLVLDKDKINVQLPVIGRQFVSNALAAASVGHALGLSIDQIKRGLEGFAKPEHRMSVVRLRSGTLLIDDSYNNNPEAAREALFTLKEIAQGKKTIVVFGDMLELGKREKDYHQELGRFISSLDIDYLIGVGSLSKYVVLGALIKMKGDNVSWVSSQEKVDSILKPYLKKGAVLLIKGSRSIKLEKLVSRLS